MTIHAIILTGGREGHAQLLGGSSLMTKAMLPVDGKPMVETVFETVSASRYQPKMYISTGDPEIRNLKLPVPFTALPSEGSAVSSLLESLARVNDAEDTDETWVFFISGDHPLVTPEMVDYFIDEAISRNLDMAVAVVSKSTVDKAYPESVRTYFKAKDDAYSGGNMYLIHKRRFSANADVLRAIDDNRKKPWKSIGLLPLWPMVRIAFRLADMDGVADEASKIIGCKTGVVSMPWAEACMDVDKPSDKEIAEKILAKRRELQATGLAQKLPDQHVKLSQDNPDLLAGNR